MKEILVNLPEDLVREVTELVGELERDQFIKDAIKSWMRERKNIRKVMEEYGGIAPGEEGADWSTSEKAYAWVRESRRLDNERSRKLWGGESGL